MSGKRSRHHPRHAQSDRRYFDVGPTADIGCGSVRDTQWLTGYDTSERLLAEARRLHPSARYAALPELHNIADETFCNVLCETVIMHLPPDAIISDPMSPQDGA